MKSTPYFLGLAGILILTVRPAVAQSPPNQLSDKSIIGQAVWISDGKPLPEHDSLFYPDDPAPLFRYDFTVGRDVANAEMQITAAGYVETWLNGTRVGDEQLSPAWTNYGKRIYLSRFDVTALLKQGANAWGIILGNGFYNPLPLRMWGGRNLRKDLPVGRPSALATLRVTYRDGTSQEFHTSPDWKFIPGPVVRNSVYLGELYDARREIPGWCDPSVPPSGWKPAAVVKGPGGIPEVAGFPPIRIRTRLEPVSITQREGNRQIVDFGQNFAGLIRVRIRAQAGDSVRFRYGELLYPDGSLNPMTAVCGQIKRAGVGGPGAPAVAEQADLYIARGGGEEYFQPRFTFHGFRYVEVSGLNNPLDRKDMEGLPTHTDVIRSGSVTSSLPYLDRLDEICRRTFLSNLQGVQSDCPAREKFGYGGDINATFEAYISNFDMHGIYKKIILDWTDAMKSEGFIDTAPFVGIEYCGLSWESAFLFLQDALLAHYGDSTLIRELYAYDVAWMDKVERLHPGRVVDNGLSDHESLAKVPVELTGTAHYLRLARIMAGFASVAGDPEGVRRYAVLAEEIRNKLVDLFWDSPSVDVPNRQTLLATLLACQVLDPEDRPAALTALVDEIEKADYHITTGIFGTEYLLEALSANGRTDVALRMVTQPGFSGWRHMVDNGATTLWETWKQSDNTFSQNHPMFGSVSAWYYRWPGGIRPDRDQPGTARILLDPQPVAGLDSVTAEKFFRTGKLVSRWHWKDGRAIIEFVIPEGVKARWPGSSQQAVRSRQSAVGSRQQAVRTAQGYLMDKPGVYQFELIYEQ